MNERNNNWKEPHFYFANYLLLHLHYDLNSGIDIMSIFSRNVKIVLKQKFKILFKWS